jgi:hypothetical protein
MLYRARILPAIVGALSLGATALAAESGQPEWAPTAGNALRVEGGAAALRIAPVSAPRTLPLPEPDRVPAALPAAEVFHPAFARPSRAPAAMAPDDYRLSARSASAPPLKLSPSHAATRTGWHWSGRVGPLRWMSPLDGEGESKLRFGGRLPGQPRMPGMGHFNVGIHYTFE